MTYAIGPAWSPDTEKDQDCWTLDINYISENESIRRSHWACIQVHAATLDLCLLKAKIICNALNDRRFAAAETMVEKLTLHKDNGPII